LAGLGQPYCVVFADKQLVTQEFLQGPDALADGALRQVQFDRGPAEAEAATPDPSEPQDVAAVKLAVFTAAWIGSTDEFSSHASGVPRRS
jgi:hypothetical protein